jgi:hypothetical protein
MIRIRLPYLSVFVVILLGIVIPGVAWAIPSTSTNYRLDPDAMNTAGGLGTSSSYKLLSSVGESLIGNGEGGSYKLTSGYISQLQQSIELSVNPSGLMAYYPMDTNLGTRIYDTTSNNRHGTMQNGPTWTTGKIGNALQFNGSNTYVQPFALTFPSGFSWGAWINPGNVAGSGVVLGAGDSTYNSLQVTTNKLNSQLYINGSNRAISSASNLSNGTWYFVMVTYNGSSVNMYINGAADGTPVTGISGSLQHTDGTDLNIGRRDPSGAAGYFNGKIDEVMIYNRGLTSDEVRDIYNAQSAGVRSALTLPSVTPGASQTVDSDITVLTDAGGYDLAIQQNNNLKHTDNSTTISAISSGDIITPATWTEGTTKGLGFTLKSGVSLPAKWGTTPNFKYSAIPGSSTTFYSRTGLSGGAKDAMVMQHRLDVATSQKSGAYTNTVTITATTKP